MTQVTSYQVPAHPSGLDMRTQLNAIVLALVTSNSGPTAPTPTYPGMFWGDTTANRFKRRTNANDAWIDLGPLDNFLADINTSVSNKVSKTGDTMTGALTLYNTGTISYQLYLRAGSYNPHIRSNSSFYGFEWVNTANNAVPMSLSDAGTLAVTQGFTTGVNGEFRYTHSKGYIRARGDGGIGSNGGMGIVNYAGNAWRFQITDEGYWSFTNYAFSPVNVMNSATAPDPNGYQSTIGPGYIKTNEYNYGPYHDFSRARSEDYVWRLHYNFNNVNLEFLRNGNGNVQFSQDGNIYCSSQGWMSDKAGKVNCQWNSGVTETGPIYGGQYDANSPQVLMGVRGGTGQSTANFIFIRFVWMRNF